MSSIKITVIQNQSEVCQNSPAVVKSQSQPSTPSKKTGPKRKVYLNKQLICAPVQTTPVRTVSTILVSESTQDMKQTNDQDMTHVEDFKYQEQEETNNGDKDDLRPISSTSTNNDEYLDITIDEKDSSIIV